MDKNLVALTAILLLIIVLSGFGYRYAQIKQQEDMILAQQQAEEAKKQAEEQERLRQEEERLREEARLKKIAEEKEYMERILADTETFDFNLQLRYYNSDLSSPGDWCEFQDLCIYSLFQNETFEKYEKCPIKDKHHRYSEDNQYYVPFSFEIPKVYLDEHNRVCVTGEGELETEAFYPPGSQYPCRWTVFLEEEGKTNGFILEDKPYSICFDLR